MDEQGVAGTLKPVKLPRIQESDDNERVSTNGCNSRIQPGDGNWCCGVWKESAGRCAAAATGSGRTRLTARPPTATDAATCGDATARADGR